MAIKKIAIIGGGISGLAALHFLKKRFNDGIELQLLERESTVGGTIRTVPAGEGFFETGPNGFLDNQPATLELINELGLTDQIIQANVSAKRRYIQIQGKLYQVPQGLLSFITTSLLSPLEKFRFIQGFFIKGISTDQSIYAYTSQRFSPRVSERLVDPFISGIYAGDIKQLHMASAFPKMFGGKKKPHMRSFKKGMGQLIEAFQAQYQAHIQTNREITSLTQIDADAIILATPAYVSAKLMEDVNPAVSAMLNKIVYAPVAVAGVMLKQDYLKKHPDGFGYLVPSDQHKDVLGVLIESNAFTLRCPQDHVVVRIMMGGAHHPAIINDSPEQILAKAIQEIDIAWGLKQMPLRTFVKLWPKAIPQYDLNYPALRQAIAKNLAQTPKFHLCANYLDGISFNDCINNAKSIAANIPI